MIKDHKIISIITARGGSKGLPKKNIKKLQGKPLIAWTIEAAKKSKYLDKIIVTTDSKEISEVAKEFGAEVPFIRPSHLATDNSSSFDTIKHALNFQEFKNDYDIVVILETTSPLRETKDIDNSLEQLIDSPTAKSIVGVCKTEVQNPIFLYRIESSGMLNPLTNKSTKVIRRQDIDNIYFLEGTIYASWIDTFLEKEGFYHDKTAGYIVPKWKSFEVDDIVDWYCIDAMMRNIKELKSG